MDVDETPRRASRRYTAAHYDPPSVEKVRDDAPIDDGCPHDPALLKVCKKLDAGLKEFFARKGKHIVVGASWGTFFEMVDLPSGIEARWSWLCYGLRDDDAGSRTLQE